VGGRAEERQREVKAVRGVPTGGMQGGSKEGSGRGSRDSMDSYDTEDTESEEMQTYPAGTGPSQYEGILPGHQLDSLPMGGIQKKTVKNGWSRGADFFFSSLCFSLSLHSIWSFPHAVLKHGGATFLIMYLVLMLLLGLPLLLVELFLGQYSGQALIPMFRNLVPLARGMGFALCCLAVMRLLVDLSAAMWMGKLLIDIVTDKEGFSESRNLFYNEVLKKPSESGLDDLGPLQPEILISLSVVVTVIYLFSVGGPRVLGKICGGLVIVTYGFMLTLIIRVSMNERGPSAVLAFLTPKWGVMTEPTVWLRAGLEVILSLQLGLGVQTTLSSYSRLKHNIVRDTAILGAAHLLWVLMATYLIFALLGDSAKMDIQTMNISDIGNDKPSSTPDGIWLVLITLIDGSLAKMNYGWLWAAFFLVLLLLVSISSLLGYVELLINCSLYKSLTLQRWRPLFLFLILAALFLLTLPMTTQGGIHPFHIFQIYSSSWPCLLFSLLILSCSLSHGPKHMLEDLSNMCQTKFSSWVSCHLSVLYYSLIPIFLMSCLGWKLYTLSLEHLTNSFKKFEVALPDEWGVPLALGLSCLPILPLLLGALYHLTCGARGHKWSKHIKNSLRPTVSWHWQQNSEEES